jgi:hypothetical protein
MVFNIRIAPPYSVLLLISADDAEIPQSLGGATLAATSSCLVVGTLSEQDGETLVTVTDEATDRPALCDLLLFDGLLNLRANQLSVINALNEPICVVPHPNGNVRVQVWVNHQSEPDEVTFVIYPPELGGI